MHITRVIKNIPTGLECRVCGNVGTFTEISATDRVNPGFDETVIECECAFCTTRFGDPQRFFITIHRTEGGKKI